MFISLLLLITASSVRVAANLYPVFGWIAILRYINFDLTHSVTLLAP